MKRNAKLTALIKGVGIAEVVGAFITLTDKSGKLAGPSPLKDGTAPRSLTVQVKAGTWECKATGKQGDALDFLEEAAGMTRGEATNWLAERAAAAPVQSPVDKPEPMQSPADYHAPALWDAKGVVRDASRLGAQHAVVAVAYQARALVQQGVPAGTIAEALTQSAQAVGLVTPEELAAVERALATGLDATAELPEPPTGEHVPQLAGDDRPHDGYGAAQPAPPRFTLIRLQDIKVGTGRAYLVKHLLPRVGLVVIWGPPKCGKSFVTFDMVMHVAMGLEYRGRRVQQGPVLYIGLEGAEGLGKRSEAARIHFGMAPDKWHALPIYYITQAVNLIADHERLIADAKVQLAGVVPVCVVLDTLNRSFFGSENKDEDMSKYVRASDALRDAFRCAVLIVHHCGIDGTRPRGHSSLTAAADAQLAVKRTHNGLIEVAVEYMKDGPEGDSILSKLQPIVVGTDDDGEPIKSCAVLASGEMTRPSDQKTRNPDAVFLKASRLTFFRDALLSAIAEHGVPPLPGMNLPPSVPFVVEYEHVKRKYRERVLPEEADAKKNAEGLKKALQRHREYGYQKGVLGTVNVKDVGYIWPTGKPVYSDGFYWPPRERHQQAAAAEEVEQILDTVTGEAITEELF